MAENGLPVSRAKGVYDSIDQTIGHTPLVRLRRVVRGLPCPVYAKLESFNPGGSVKDRIAFPILEAFERQGSLKPGGTVVEATSGNTGVGLAIACALKGYQAVFVMPDKMSEDKVRLLRAFGARVVITPTAVEPDDPRSYYSVAQRIVRETPNAVLANQYHNPANPEAHYLTTAPEIWEQTEGRVTRIVIGMGTGGTITGVGRWMREHGHPVRLVGVDPMGSILYDAWRHGGSTEGLVAETYKVEGIGEDFIPGTLDLSLVDEVVQVSDGESFLWARRLVREEGIFCGGSSGSALAGVHKIATSLSEDDLVVVIFPDNGYRYLTKLFNDDWMREHGFLQFRRQEATAEQVAAARGLPTLITARMDSRKLEVISRMREYGISQLPVVDEIGRLAGMVSEVELMQHMLSADHEHSPEETIEDVINREVRTADPDARLEDVLPELVANKVVVLVNALDQPVGILTLIDALDFLAEREKASA
jgi:cystathionine beta-synthase